MEPILGDCVGRTVFLFLIATSAGNTSPEECDSAVRYSKPKFYLP